MARPREFDVDKAVEAAMHVFWLNGYQGTSLPDLLDGIGIARGSLYKAFGSKKELFLRALELYDQRYVEPGVVHLKDKSEPSGETRIKNVFAGAISVVRDGDRRGCLLCNTAAGSTAGDAEISKVINGLLDRLTDAFEEALIASATFKDKSTRRSKAHNLTLTYVGLRVMAKTGIDADSLEIGAMT